MPTTTLIISALNIIFAIPIISFVHELGIFLVSKACKLNIREISLGVGPIIFIRKKYEIRLFPLIFHVEWDSKQLRNKFLSLPYEKNYGWIMTPKPGKKYYFEDLSFYKRLLVLFSGIFNNLVLLAIILLCYTTINFEADKFFVYFFSKLFYAFNFNDLKNSIIFGGLNIYFAHTLIMLNCFFIFINFFPLYYLDGYKIFANIYEKITKKSINWITNIIICACSAFLLSWIFYGFFISWWN